MFLCLASAVPQPTQPTLLLCLASLPLSRPPRPPFRARTALAQPRPAALARRTGELPDRLPATRHHARDAGASRHITTGPQPS